MPARRPAVPSNDAYFKALIQNASDIILVVNADGVVTYCTPSIERILGWPVGDIEQQSLRALLHPADVGKADDLLSPVRVTQAPRIADCRLRHAGGLLRSFEVVSSNLLDDPNVAGIVLTMRDVSERRALEERLKQQAFHDGLTGLANRALFHDRAGHALVNGSRLRRPVALVTLDLDDFKVVNDTHGHGLGDLLLQAFADRIVAELRPGDTAARLGGDEFAVLIEDVADAAAAERIVVRLLEVLNAPFLIQGESWYAHTSAGLAFADAAVDSIEVSEMLRRADLAMYAAKERGKNGFVTYYPELHSKVVDRVVRKSQLQQALDADEFVLFYQPIVRLDTGEIVGAEALLRWLRPGQEVLLPWDFIGLAEETGIIVPLGRWVLDQACQQVKSWMQEFDRPLRVSVNVSAAQLNDSGFVDDVRATLGRHDLSPSSLFLELTETLLVDDGSGTPQRLRELRELGVSLAIDDFGTGYSSLGYLQRFPIDILKVDKLFVDGLGTGDDDQGTLARAVISLAQALRLEIVAEGIETVEQRNDLIALGCTWGQGYLYARPIVPAALRSMLVGTGRIGPVGSGAEYRPAHA